MHPIYSSILTEVRVNPKYIMNSSQHQATPMINMAFYTLKTGKNTQPTLYSARKPEYAQKSTYIQAACTLHVCTYMCTRAHIHKHACTNAQLYTSMSPRTHKRTLWHKECSRLTDLGQ